jgi:hypothetical protein
MSSVFGQSIDKIDSSDVLAWDPCGTRFRFLGRTLPREAVFDGRSSMDTAVMVNDVRSRCQTVRGNPHSASKQNRKQRHHEALLYKELSDFVQRLRISPSALSMKLAFEFLILTCARTSEFFTRHGREFNLDDAVCRRASERMDGVAQSAAGAGASRSHTRETVQRWRNCLPGRYPGKPSPQWLSS